MARSSLRHSPDGQGSGGRDDHGEAGHDLNAQSGEEGTFLNGEVAARHLPKTPTPNIGHQIAYPTSWNALPITLRTLGDSAVSGDYCTVVSSHCPDIATLTSTPISVLLTQFISQHWEPCVHDCHDEQALRKVAIRCEPRKRRRKKVPSQGTDET
jgi:hypothetical protein